METGNNSRTSNALKSSVSGVVCLAVSFIMLFVFQTVIIDFLSVDYLGINSLFKNIVTVISVLELGISLSVTCHLYKPYSEDDRQHVGQLMFWFRRVYQKTGCLILLIGIGTMPFIGYFIYEENIPDAADIRLMFLLFLIKAVSSYFFSYRFIILVADQKQYLMTAIQTVIEITVYIVQILSIVLTSDYMISLSVGAAFSVLSYFLMGLLVKRMYRDVFSVKCAISKEEKKEIISELKGTACHKIGGTVLFGTDTIIVSKYLGLTVAGLFANYSLILSGIQSLIGRIFESISGSIGNANVEVDRRDKLKIFYRLEFANLWISGVFACCVFMLIDDFVAIWLGREFVISGCVGLVFGLQIFLESGRNVHISFENACGLYVYDKIRPFIEVTVNILTSIILVKTVGFAGVIIGTVVSHLVTVIWREPHVIFREVFHTSTTRYWKTFISFSALTGGSGAALWFVKILTGIVVNNIALWIAEGVICFTVVNAVFVLFFRKNDEFIYYRDLVNKYLKVRKQ